jgi:hypothetical protein
MEANGKKKMNIAAAIMNFLSRISPIFLASLRKKKIPVIAKLKGTEHINAVE